MVIVQRHLTGKTKIRMELKLRPIATVKNSRLELIDDHWESIVADDQIKNYWKYTD